MPNSVFVADVCEQIKAAVARNDIDHARDVAAKVLAVELGSPLQAHEFVERAIAARDKAASINGLTSGKPGQ